MSAANAVDTSVLFGPDFKSPDDPPVMFGQKLGYCVKFKQWRLVHWVSDREKWLDDFGSEVTILFWLDILPSRFLQVFEGKKLTKPEADQFRQDMLDVFSGCNRRLTLPSAHQASHYNKLEDAFLIRASRPCIHQWRIRLHFLRGIGYYLWRFVHSFFHSPNVKGRHGVKSRSDVTELSYPALLAIVCSISSIPSMSQNRAKSLRGIAVPSLNNAGWHLYPLELVLI